MKQRLLSILMSLAVGLLLMPTQALASIYDVTWPNRVSVHDPSVVIGYVNNGKITGEKSAQKVYYIFGSHLAFARSKDLQNWDTLTNNINRNYSTIFAKPAAWSAKGSTNYNVNGNMWAPDVIWNKALGKWCMYMSINGDAWYSSICMLTAESLDGDWTYMGQVVYSGFQNKDQAMLTDFYKVHTSDSNFPSRYNASGLQIYKLNAIDPCVFYDEEGNLWMTYGSWSGGLYMLRLDANTGLRDYTYTYETVTNKSDEYQGIKLGGGYYVSGEASYIEYIGDRYYLFVTNGGLETAGGYNMRVYSSTDVKGPYKDLSGQSAIYTSYINNLKNNVGTQLMNYYQWSTMSYGYCAEGHNSAVVDDDGKAYVVYHTRSTTWGEGHQVRVHQLFQAKNGGLVAAPFEYRGETVDKSKVYTMEEVAGTYKVIVHKFTDFTKKVCNQEQTITLNANGSIFGNYVGTWTLSDAGPYITLKETGRTTTFGTIEGVLVEQLMEGLNYTTLCFSAVGTTDLPVWGYKEVKSDEPQDTRPVIGSTDNTTGFWAAFSDYYTIEPNGSATIKFTNYSNMANNWNNWLAVLSTDANRQAAGYSEYVVLRADNYGWQGGRNTIDDKTWFTSLESNYNWDTFKEDMNGSNVVMTITRQGAEVTILADITTTTGKSLFEKFVINCGDGTQKIRAFLTVEGGHLRLTEASTSGISSISADADSSAPSYNLRGQRVGADYKGLIIRGGKKILQK